MKKRQSAEEILAELPDAVAVIGAAVRFPGAPDLFGYRDLLASGASAVRPIDREKLAASHHAGIANMPNYVAMSATLDRVDLFDAGFFGFTPREAMLIDPQQRHILECTWHAFENAGIVPGDDENQRTAVFTSVAFSSYLSHFLLPRIHVGMVDVIEAGLSNNVDYAPSRVSYKLDLKGPSVAVQTACSSSLVATHMACRSLAERECDLAVVAASSITVPNGLGYLASDKGMLAKDGVCRPFSADATGTIFSNGAGAVLLKRLDQAVAAGDRIAAVIRGTAINNDGANRVGFTAPSIDGQSAVIAEAMGMADVAPNHLSFVEAHGTGTPLGDPIEIAALHDAYGDVGRRIPLGTVKGQVGHLDTAAGLAGLLKIAAAFEAESIPATLNLSSPNPELEIETRPFRLVQAPEPWKRGADARIAGLSSFGMGGANAHAVLQEPPEPTDVAPSRKQELFIVSGREDIDAAENVDRLGAFFEKTAAINTADVAFTLRQGRRSFPARRFLVAGSIAEAREALQHRRLQHGDGKASGKLAFVLPGQGSQYAGLALALTRTEPAFAAHFKRLRDSLISHGGPDVCRHDLDAEAARNTIFAQTALFACGVALGRTLGDLGVVPDLYIGHSVGEVAVACLAGVLDENDACRLLVARARAMNEAKRGAMVQLLCNATVAQELDDEARRPDGILDIAAMNAPAAIAVGGDLASVDRLVTAAESRKLDTIRLRTSHAFHTPMMREAAETVSRAAGMLAFKPAAVSIISTLTGRLASGLLLSDPDYWHRQMLSPVRFADALKTAQDDDVSLFVELGPAGGLQASLAQCEDAPRAIAMLPNARQSEVDGADQRRFLETIGTLWASGHAIDWNVFDRPFLPRRKVELPFYAFRQERHWPEAETTPVAPVATVEHAPSHPSAMPRQARPALANAYVAPQGNAETMLAGLWEDLLLIAPIGRDDDFIALGGASITALQLVQALAQKGHRLTVRDIFDNRILANLAVLLEPLPSISDPRPTSHLPIDTGDDDGLDLEALATIRSRLKTS